jgi:NADH dehydrogenase (ubiquinone) 1 alpha subcomplex subunit 6
MRSTQALRVTIPTRLARPAQVSTSRADARSRALALYRQYYRSAPEIVSLFAMDIPPSTLRAKYRQMFEKNRHVEDLAVIDVMLHKGQVEFQETINAWKQVPHMMKLFTEEEVSIQNKKDEFPERRTKMTLITLLSILIHLLCTIRHKVSF